MTGEEMKMDVMFDIGRKTWKDALIGDLGKDGGDGQVGNWLGVRGNYLIRCM